jgi:ribosomal protein S27E
MREFLKNIHPASEVECGVCGGPLVIGDEQRCVKCDAERIVVS